MARMACGALAASRSVSAATSEAKQLSVLTVVTRPSACAARARELFLLPGRLPARAAQAEGLVTTVSTDSCFASDVAALTERLAASAPQAIRAMKRNLHDADRMALSDYLDVESERMVATFHTEDAREAARAFLERREPIFTGS
jgi:2-(1,2-epoxy-1,2-dihydrophenyl)acetyl-CoA isomerase